MLPALCPLRTRYVPCGKFSSGLHQKLWITLFHRLPFKDCPDVSSFSDYDILPGQVFTKQIIPRCFTNRIPDSNSPILRVGSRNDRIVRRVRTPDFQDQFHNSQDYGENSEITCISAEIDPYKITGHAWSRRKHHGPGPTLPHLVPAHASHPCRAAVCSISDVLVVI